MATPIDLHAVAELELEARSRYPWRIKACTSTACQLAGAQNTFDSMQDEIERDGRSREVQLNATGCMGMCSRGPLVRVLERGHEETMYQLVDEDVGREIVRSHVGARTTLEEHVLDHRLPFFALQERVVLTNAGIIDPDRLESAVAHGAYGALAKALADMTPEQVVEELRASGLRGRGGAGYPTGNKWALLAGAEADQKFVIANGDEGDPGAFMDRTVMEDDPHRVIEGMAIAAYATGASRGYIYVRAEYPKAVERLDRAIRAARRNRLLGRRILDFDFDFEVEVRIGAGAFVCGEETALIASIEGRRGTPRLRPPYPTEAGLFGKPSMINNVETLANIPKIIEQGAAWFRSRGTPASPGTKVFALAGGIRNTGLIEVPMGIPLRTIVEEMGGGVPDGGTFKAAQTGGPSGGCIPAEFLDTPVDYESLRELGSIMGSGGLVVMDDSVSMPEVARFFMEFCMDESCGKCVPCRAGTVQIHGLLDKICSRRADRGDLDLLDELCALVRETSLCGLGQSAPNPVISTLHYFRSEYEELLATKEGADA
jgi:bidirectional [NiFe] hydrogenase diaphorase subunit